MRNRILTKAAALGSAALLGLSLLGCSTVPQDTAAEAVASAEATTSAKPAAENSGHRHDGPQGSTEAAMSAAAGAEVPTETDFKKKDLNDSWDTGATEIQLTGGSAACTDASVSIDGQTVTITSEGTYLLSGTLSDGQIIVAAGDADDVQLVLNGADISCSNGPAMHIKTADKVVLTLAAGTENKIADGGAYADASASAPNAAVYAEEDLSINGQGSLTVTANCSNGIATKDDLKIADGSLTVTAPNHAIKGKDSVSIAGGTFVLEAGGDAIQSDQDADPAKGWIVIDDGNFTITAGGDAIQAETGLTIHGGTFDVTTNGGYENGETHSQGGLGGGGFGGFTRPGWNPDNADGSGFGGFERPDGAGESGFGGSERPDGADESGFGGSERPDGTGESGFGGFGRPHGGRGRVNDQPADGTQAATDAQTSLVPLSAQAEASGEAVTKEASGDTAAEAAEQGAQAQETLPGGRQRPDAETSATELRPDGIPSDRGPQSSSADTSANSGDSCKGLKSGGNLLVNGGSFQLNSADDGVHANGGISLLGGSFNIASGDDAVHADGSLTTRADLEITESREGLEALTINIEDGTINLKSSDDGVNASGGNQASVNISGGTLKAVCGGDGIDSNGDVTVSGGDVCVLINSSADNGAIDAERSFVVTGGSLVYGGTGTGAGPGSGSSQSYVCASGSFKAGETVTLRLNGQDLMNCTLDIDCSSLIFSRPGMEAGATYEVYAGGAMVAQASAGQGGSGMEAGGGMGGQRPGMQPAGAQPDGAASDAAVLPENPDASSSDAGSRPQRPSRGSAESGRETESAEASAETAA